MNLSTLGPEYLVCHKSTVCMQGVAVGIRALYVARPDYMNFAIESGIAQRVDTPEEVRHILGKKEALKHAPHLENLGIPICLASK